MYSLGTQPFVPFELPGLDSRYEILDLLDRGGMSVVYKARDKVLERTVAIKTIKTSRLEQKQLVSFQIEARAICSLTHEGIVRVLDFGVMKTGQPYLVLDYLEGTTLAHYVNRNGALPLVDALFVMSNVCQAISHAHKHGVIHRDLKSSNIMLTNNLSARVIDFGIAVVLENASRGVTLTPSGSIVGSPAYMSPEQILQKHLDARTDIYSLGCVLFEAITGRKPFRANSALEVMHQHLNNAPPTVPRLTCDVELLPDLNALFEKALQKDPERRYQSIDEFHDDILALLERAESRESVPIQAVPPRKQLLEPRSSNQKDSQIIRLDGKKAHRASLISIAFLLSILLGIGTIFGTMVDFKGVKMSDDATDAPEGAFPRFHRADAIQDDMSELIISSADSAWKTDGLHGLNFSFSALPFGTTDLDLARTDLNKVDLAPLVRLTDLKSISFMDCNLSSENLKSITRMQSLEQINLSQNINLKPQDFRALKNLKNLNRLAADRACLTDAHIEALSECKSLRHLELDWNCSLTSKSIEYLARLPELESIDLSGWKIAPVELEPITRLKKLIYLKLDFMHLKDSDNATLTKFPHLSQLSICHSDYTYKGVTDLVMRSNSLKQLRIVGTQISEAEMETIEARFPSLTLENEVPLF